MASFTAGNGRIGVYNSSTPTLANGQESALQLDVNGNANVNQQTLQSGENQTLNRTFGGGLASYSTPLTADGLVKGTAGAYYGVVITTATAVAQIDIRDATLAGAGTVIATIPAGSAVGNTFVLPIGITCSTGIFVDYAAGATGTVVPLYL